MVEHRYNMEAIPGRVRLNLSPSGEYQFWSSWVLDTIQYLHLEYGLNEQCPAIIHKRLANNWESSLGSFYGWDMAVKYGDEFHSWIVGGWFAQERRAPAIYITRLPGRLIAISRQEGKFD